MNTNPTHSHAAGGELASRGRAAVILNVERRVASSLVECLLQHRYAVSVRPRQHPFLTTGSPIELDHWDRRESPGDDHEMPTLVGGPSPTRPSSVERPTGRRPREGLTGTEPRSHAASMPAGPTGDEMRLLTAAQVAEIMAVSREYVHRLCAAGDLESILLKGQRARRIKAASVKAWIDRQPSDAAW